MQVQSQAKLIAENRRLKARLAAMEADRSAPISIDPEEGRVTIRGFETDQYTIDELEMTSPGIKETSSTMSQVDQWVNPDGQMQIPDLGKELQKGISVDKLRMTVPFETVNSTLPKLAGEQLAEAGVSKVSLSAGESAGEVKITGRAKRLVSVGFEAVGEVSVTPSGQPKFRLKGSRVAGIPMPNFLTSVATAILAGDNMEEFGIQQSGDEFTMDPKKMMPANIDADLTAMTVSEDGFVLRTGAPSDS